jgi:hypothetical protein
MKKFLLLLIGVFLVTGIGFAQGVTITKVAEWGSGYYEDVFVRGKYAYCAARNAGLDIIDISEPTQTVRIGNYDTPGDASAVYISGNYAYVADDGSGLQIIDVSTPSTPTLTGYYDTQGEARGVFVNGNYAYVADYNKGLQIIDVSTPSNPTLTGNYNTPGHARGVYVKGNYAYVADGMNGLKIIDVSNPANPTLVGGYNTPEYSRDVYVSGDYAYVADNSAGLLIFDIASPSNPGLVGTYDTPEYAKGVFVNGNVAWVTDYEGGLQVVDISDPANPKGVGSYDTPGFAFNVYVYGNHAYVANFNYGLQIFDATDPTNPTLAGEYDNSASYLDGVFVSGNYAYVADYGRGMHIIDVSNPSLPHRASLYNENNSEYDSSLSGRDIYIRGNYAYLATSGEGLHIVDVSNPQAPVNIDRGTGSALAVYLKGNYAYVTYIYVGLFIWDVSDPSNVTITGTYIGSDALGFDAYVKGNYAYVGNGGGLDIIDVSDPYDPRWIVTDEDVHPIGLAADGNYLYTVGFHEGLSVLDISNPTTPALVGRYYTSETPGAIYVADNYAYVVDSWEGRLYVIDVSNPYEPTLAASQDASGYATDVFVKGDYAYVTGGDSAKMTIFYIDKSATSPWINVNRTHFTFAADTSGSVTGPQSLLVSNSGGGTLNWTASGNQDWLNMSPASGTDSGEVSASVDTAGLSAGTYDGTVTISAPGASNSPRTVSVTLTVYRPEQTAEPFGAYTTPTDGAAVSSSIPLTGWVLDDIGVQNVRIFRGEQGGLVYIGDGVLVEGARPDVEEAYPQYPMNYKAGWGYMLLTNFLPNGNGTFTIYAVATDMEGHQVELGGKTILVDNANAVKPFGAIDTPTQGGTASGSSYRNYGWVLTPLPNTIPTDGSTIEVWVDGVSLGNTVYNRYREDIATLFPGYNNSDGAVGYFDLDTTQLTNGVHTIYWTATDDAGNTDGIGSRYFTVQNGPGGRRAQRTSSHGAWSIEHGVGPLDVENVSRTPVEVLKGYKKNVEPQEVYPDDKGIINIQIKELQRLEIHLGSLNSSSFYSGYLVVGNQLKPLPIGSTLDVERGIFYWKAGPGYVGQYRLAFIEDHGHGNRIGKELLVTIISKF